jgi:tetratricopeptide (TPR) repeat protein
MAKPSRIGSAVSFAALATVLGGCAASSDKVQTASYQKAKPDGDVGLATRAMAALSANDVPRAIDFAERAVAKTPSDAGFRALLGNAYFAAGRFASAEAAYKDALSIYEAQPKVVLKLALAQIAQGKTVASSTLPTMASRWPSPARPRMRFRRSRLPPASKAPTAASARTLRSPTPSPAIGPRRRRLPPRTSPLTSSTPACSSGCSSPSRPAPLTRSPR